MEQKASKKKILKKIWNTGENYNQINEYLRKGEYHMNRFDGFAFIFLLGLPIILYKANLFTIKSLYYGLSGKIKVNA